MKKNPQSYISGGRHLVYAKYAFKRNQIYITLF